MNGSQQAGPNAGSVIGGCESCVHEGDPANLSNGAVWHTDESVVLPGRTAQTALKFNRTYLAQAAGPAGDFGLNWRHNYESTLLADASQNVIWIDDFGESWTYRLQSGGVYTAPLGQFAVLTSNASNFTLRFPNGVTYTYANGTVAGAPPAGKLTQIQDLHSETISLGYDSNGNLLTISNPLSGTLTLARNATGYISQVTRSIDGLSYSYTYGSDGRLASETDIAGRTTQYAYNSSQPGTFAQGMLASITDSLGRVHLFTYYDNGQVKAQFEPGNGERIFVYSGTAAQPVTSVRDIDGQTYVYRFDSNLNLIETDQPDGSKKLRSWNPSGQLASETDELGNVTQYGYDAFGNVNSIMRPDQSVTQLGYSSLGNQLVALTPPIGARVTWSRNRTTDDVIGYTKSDPNSEQSLSLTYTNDAFGGRLQTSGAAVYSDQRDASGRLTYIFDLHNPQVLKYDTLSRVIERDYQSGRVLTYSYDTLNRLTRVNDSSGPSTLNTYDNADRLTVQAVTDGTLLQTTSFQYDVRDRLTQIMDPLGHATKLAYDIQVGGGGVEIFPKPVSITDPNGNVTQFSFDTRDRVISRTDAKGAVTGYAYDAHGNLIQLTDADGNVNTFTYDVNNRLASQTRPPQLSAGSGSFPGAPTHDVTTYQYDAIDELITQSETTPTGQENSVIAYTYDPYGRLIEKNQQFTSASPTTFSFLRNDDSKYVYVPQLDTVRLAYATNAVAQVNLTYESAPPFAGIGYITIANALPANAANPMNTANIDQDRFTITRDVTGNIATISQNNQTTPFYSAQYDPAGRLTGLTGGAGYFGATQAPFTAAISYDSFGRKSSATVGDPITGAYSYDLSNQITEVKWTRGKKNVILDEILAHDQAGNITGINKSELISTAQLAQASNFAYDATNQLISANLPALGTAPAYTNAVQYDLAGNRMQDSIAGTTQVQANMFLKNNQASQAWTFDAYGTELDIQDATTGNLGFYSFRPDGKVAAVRYVVAPKDIKGQRVYYYYDPLGRRVGKELYHVTAQNTLVYQFSQSYSHLMDQDRILIGQAGDGTQTLYFDGQGVNEHLGQMNSTAVKGYETDHLGSVLNTAPGGPSNELDPWGGLLGVNPGFGVSSDPVLYAFAGMQYDPEHIANSVSSFYYDRARMYSPGLGRFLTQDPIRFAGGDINLYRYTLNQPVRLTDSSGNFVPIVSGAIGAVFGGVAGAIVAGYQGTDIGEAATVGALTGFLAGSGAALFAGGAAAAGVGLGGSAFSGFIGGSIGGATGSVVSQGLITGNINMTSAAASGVVGGLGGFGGGLGGALGEAGDVIVGTTLLPADILGGSCGGR